MMDKDSQAEFDRIVAIEPAALSEGDQAFLKARRDYLTAEQAEIFASILSEPKKAKKVSDEA